MNKKKDIYKKLMNVLGHHVKFIGSIINTCKN